MSRAAGGPGGDSRPSTAFMENAECRGAGRIMFGGDWARASQLCAQCPVLDECRDWVLAHDQDPVEGSYTAGWTPTERERILSRRRRLRRQAERREQEALALAADKAEWDRIAREAKLDRHAPGALQLCLLDALIHDRRTA